MANPLYVKDNRILWLLLDKVGTPPVWTAGTNYKLGETIVPTAPPPALVDKMFMCVGFLGKSGASQPIFPLTLTAEVVDNNILWQCQDPNVSPEKLDKSEYLLIDEVVTTT